MSPDSNGRAPHQSAADSNGRLAATVLTPTPKKIVICLDGTGNQIGGSRLPTNVAKIYQMLELQLPDKQIGYYDPGVGTLPASTARGRIGRRISQGMQLAFGRGMRANLTQAYTWLMQHYQPKDEIYIFGFSRGAYTARALAGMLIRPGLLRPGSENLIDYAMMEYAANRKVTTQSARGIAEFADSFCWGTEHTEMFPNWTAVTGKNPDFKENIHSVPIAYMGLWDTVKAAGIPGFAGDVRWAFTDELWNAERIRHAVSIDERRFPFKYEPILLRKNVEEVWFAGVHSDVGGTFPDHELATIALKWIVDGACRDIVLREGRYADSFASNTLDPCGAVNKMSSAWKLLPGRPRVYQETSLFHDSVRERKAALNYLPTLTLPEDSGRWVDRRWRDPESGTLTLDTLQAAVSG
jgi:uncharacterized protein (DUF2235 family)